MKHNQTVVYLRTVIPGFGMCHVELSPEWRLKYRQEYGGRIMVYGPKGTLPK